MSFGNLSELGRLSFSERVSEALRRLEKKAGSKSCPSDDAILDFVSSHILIYESEIQKLEVIRLLIDYFNGSSYPDEVFRLLFKDPCHDSLMQTLISASIGLKSSALLISAGNFYLSLPETPPRLSDLSKALLKDFLPNLSESLSSLPSLSHSLTYALLLVLPSLNPLPLLPTIQEWLLSSPLETLLPPVKNKITPRLCPPLLGLPLWTLFLQGVSQAEDIHLTLLNFMVEIQQGLISTSFVLESKQCIAFLNEIDSKESDKKEAILDKTGQLLQGLISSKIIQPSSYKDLKSSLGKLKEQNHLLSMIHKNL